MVLIGWKKEKLKHIGLPPQTNGRAHFSPGLTSALLTEVSLSKASAFLPWPSLVSLCLCSNGVRYMLLTTAFLALTVSVGFPADLLHAYFSSLAPEQGA